MKISLRISGLIFVLAGILFLVSAVIKSSVLLYVLGTVCVLCGIFFILPRRIKERIHTKKPGGGRYSR